MVSWSYLFYNFTNDKNKIGSNKHKQETDIFAFGFTKFTLSFIVRMIIGL